MGKIEKKTNYGSIILAIAQGNKTLSQIAEHLEKSKPTIRDQLDILLNNGYIMANGGERKGFSVKYTINKNGLIDYWAKIYKKDYNRKMCLHNFDQWLVIVSSLSKMFPITIDSIGYHFYVSQNIADLGVKSALDLTLNQLVSMNLNPSNKSLIKKNLKYFK